VGQFQKSVERKTVSRKGAKAQRKNAKLLNAACSLRLLLCTFARASFVMMIYLNSKLNHYRIRLTIAPINWYLESSETP
jgi:hypothetical protein